MDGPSIEFDTALDLCRDQHRRIVLAVLASEQRSLTLNDLTKTVVKHNHHVPPTEISEEAASQIQLSLYHVHLPKLEAAGILEYDAERHLVEPTDQFGQLQPQLLAIINADPALDPPIEL